MRIAPLILLTSLLSIAEVTAAEKCKTTVCQVNQDQELAAKKHDAFLAQMQADRKRQEAHAKKAEEDRKKREEAARKKKAANQSRK